MLKNSIWNTWNLSEKCAPLWTQKAKWKLIIMQNRLCPSVLYRYAYSKVLFEKEYANVHTQNIFHSYENNNTDCGVFSCGDDHLDFFFNCCILYRTTSWNFRHSPRTSDAPIQSKAKHKKSHRGFGAQEENKLKQIRCCSLKIKHSALECTQSKSDLQDWAQQISISTSGIFTHHSTGVMSQFLSISLFL